MIVRRSLFLFVWTAWLAHTEIGLLRNTENLVRSPTRIEPIPQRVLRNTCVERPVLQTFCLAAVRQPHIVSAITQLFRTGCPFAVAGLVSAFIVDSFQRHSGRTPAHIRKELSKRVSPLLANRDSSSAVVFPAIRTRIVAALQHILPRRVCRRTGHSVTGINLIVETSAGHGSSIPQSGTINLSNRSTVTETRPKTAIARTDSHPSANPPTRHIYKAADMPIILRSPLFNGGLR